jgi:hypothetical protein
LCFGELGTSHKGEFSRLTGVKGVTWITVCLFNAN